jgi:hypothetical protein
MDSGLLNGATAFIEPGAAALAALAFGRIDPGTTTLGGAIGGIGFGAALSGPNRSMALQVRPDQRGGLFAAVFVIGYLAFGIPVVLAGQAADRIGLAPAVTAYVLVMLGVAVVGLLAESRHDRAAGIGPVHETPIRRQRS